MIEPRVLKGFRDFLPESAGKRKEIIRRLEGVFESFGFASIDTPVLEYRDVLLGKGGGETDKQVYAFQDQGGRDVAMRFDLTVPFARFMAAHFNELHLPFKRYHIDKVWRGENTQKGRYREFVQCDFDIVGIDNLSADLEILLMMNAAFEALGISEVQFKINHRGIFNRFLAKRGIDGQSVEILRIVDKLAKIGEEEVRRQLMELIGEENSSALLDYISPEENSIKTLDKIEELAGGECDESTRMRSLLAALKELGIADRFLLDSSITRGLDYYTGLVYETFLTRLPSIGSVCSGGRYNNLASLYTKQDLPGVGSSIGLDRLVAALEELEDDAAVAKTSDIAVFCLDDTLIPYYHRIAADLRKAGFSCEVFLHKQKMGKQFSLSEKKGISFAVICGEDEKAAAKVSVKNLQNRESKNMVTIDEAIQWLKEQA